ncbi:threonine ammonia-lyase IlvA [Enterococcus saccharolyticus]|uniref:L-threonine dehydratase n=1 Tax=Enterococcus saccharolyticus subsp. saccharolyticus ATCC 43076 TaxID=1139996 RepID=S0JMD6_9ENTE|nr:threonine ammonia-lyase IlvA [Enterococcus saccharolyticus]EOT29033.1 threonine dehydratase [Enterococcus saccharolyticus subsp. saccharolyticus ATCC 43076]EOT81399.1 threonine dehydratase [Enterococcus saccharolyticus subsp. saccharolyticus ATCC 43076]
MGLVTRNDVDQAYQLLKSAVAHTPLQYDRYLSEKYQATILLKREDLQKVRSFKLRGAYYAIKKRSQSELAAGVVCASAGNHAQGVAYTCREIGVQAVIFMPSTTPQQKVSQVSFFGGNNVTIELVGDTFDASAAAAKAFAKEKGMAFIDPFDDPAIIAGQGTLAVEMMADALAESYQPDYVIAAIGGGGLISGVSTYVKDVSPVTKIIGVEPKGAPSMQEAFDYGAPIALEQLDKFVDGAAVKEVGQLTYQHAKEYVDQLMTVDEGLVCSTILELYSKQAIVAEPAGALSVAALEAIQDEIKGKTVICIISGGNNDINRMAEIEERSLIYQGLMNYFVINFPQRPGALKEFVNDVLGPDDDITRFEYTKKINRGSGPVVLGVLSKTREDVPSLFERIVEFDPTYIDLSENQSLFTLLV